MCFGWKLCMGIKMGENIFSSMIIGRRNLPNCVLISAHKKHTVAFTKTQIIWASCMKLGYQHAWVVCFRQYVMKEITASWTQFSLFSKKLPFSPNLWKNCWSVFLRRKFLKSTDMWLALAASFFIQHAAVNCKYDIKSTYPKQNTVPKQRKSSMTNIMQTIQVRFVMVISTSLLY